MLKNTKYPHDSTAFRSTERSKEQRQTRSVKKNRFCFLHQSDVKKTWGAILQEKFMIYLIMEENVLKHWRFYEFTAKTGDLMSKSLDFVKFEILGENITKIWNFKTIPNFFNCNSAKMFFVG